VLTTETQNKSLLSGFLGGSLSGIIGSITGSTPATPSLDSLLNSLLSGKSLSSSSLIDLITRPLAKVLFLTILDFDIYLKINAYQ